MRSISPNQVYWDLLRFGLTPAKLLRRLRNAGAPILFCNSIPKAGTHLLERVLCLHPQVFRTLLPRYVTGSQMDGPKSLEGYLRRLRPGQLGMAHLDHKPAFEKAVRDYCPKFLFLIRDPRDVVVSNAYYIARARGHRLHRKFASEPSLGRRIRMVIEGAEGPRGLESIGSRYRTYRGWLQAGGVVLRFEDLVDKTGFADPNHGSILLQRIYEHVGLNFDAPLLRQVAANVVSRRSATFRKGVSGEWRKHFDDELIELFKQSAGQELIEYGYEEDPSW